MESLMDDFEHPHRSLSPKHISTTEIVDLCSSPVAPIAYPEERFSSPELNNRETLPNPRATQKPSLITLDSDDLDLLEYQPRKKDAILTSKTDMTRSAPKKRPTPEYFEEPAKPARRKKADSGTDKADKELAKLLKQKDKEEKARKKAELAAEKQLAKEEKAKQKAEEAAVKRASKTANKLRAKDDTLVDMKVLLNRRLIESGSGGIILAKLQEAQVRVQISDFPDPISARWQRKVTREWDAENACWHPCDERVEDEAYLVVVMNGTDFAKILADRSGLPPGGSAPLRHAALIQGHLPGATIIYIIESMEQYYRFKDNAVKRTFMEEVRNRKDQGRRTAARVVRQTLEYSQLPDKDGIENGLLDLQMAPNVLVQMSADTAETSEWIYNFTRELSTVPELRSREEALSLNFGDDVRSGKGPADSWARMLRELRVIGEPVSVAIANAYPTPRALFDAYSSCVTLKGKEELLVGIQVERMAGKVNQSIGVTRSKKVFAVLTGTDPNEILDL
ncbi:hypothetical protein BJ742DRAFT_37283 [Cladochytrium replicatum]|nr:hypothetical protein BJ742DRAFT_37283 [Cladochytrium replicatum]